MKVIRLTEIYETWKLHESKTYPNFKIMSEWILTDII